MIQHNDSGKNIFVTCPVLPQSTSRVRQRLYLQDFHSCHPSLHALGVVSEQLVSLSAFMMSKGWCHYVEHVSQPPELS